MNAFVLMPFSLEFKPVFEELISPALEEVGFQVSRADSVLDQQNILTDIVKGIHGADLVVADLTGLNPNVLYELGICHGLNVPTVLLTQNIDEVPFDLRAYRLHVYSTTFHEAEKLPSFLKRVGMEHLRGKIAFGSPVSDFLRLPPPSPSARAAEDAGGSHSSGNAAAEAGASAHKVHSVGVVASTDLVVADSSAVQYEPGWLDLISERDEVLDELTATYELMAESISEMGSRMNEHSVQLNELTETKVPRAAGAARRVAAIAARDMEKHAKDLNDLMPVLEPNSERLIELLADPRLLKLGREPSDIEGREESSRELRNLLQSNQQSLSSIKVFRDSVRSLRDQGISRETNRAAATLRLSLDKVIQTMELVESGLVRVVALLENRRGVTDENAQTEREPAAREDG